jgi:hypothetical protein
MKQHEALSLAVNCPVGDAAKFVLLALVAKLDWNTWAKPMSVSYIEKALRTKSRSTISRGLVELQTKGIIERYEIEGRADGVRLIKLNTSALSTLCQPDIPPMSERHTPYVTETHPPMSERHTPYVSVTYPLCQPDIPPMSERHTPYVSVTDNIICNNLSTNLSTNLNDQEPSQEATHQTEGMSQEDSEPNEWGYRDRVKAAQQSGDWSVFWGTSSSNDEPEPEPQPQPQPQPQPMRYEERARRAKELMHRSYK